MVTNPKGVIVSHHTSLSPPSEDMGIIFVALTQGKFALIDSADFELIQPYTWAAHNIKGRLYAVTRGGRLHMHRVIAAAKSGQTIDHRNGDGLDNRRANLRVCTVSQNGMNRPKQANNTSGFKGVFPSGRPHQPWSASIKKDQRVIHLGRFGTPEQAALAYDRAAAELFGEFAVLNFPEGRVSI